MEQVAGCMQPSRNTRPIQPQLIMMKALTVNRVGKVSATNQLGLSHAGAGSPCLAATNTWSSRSSNSGHNSRCTSSPVSCAACRLSLSCLIQHLSLCLFAAVSLCTSVSLALCSCLSIYLCLSSSLQLSLYIPLSLCLCLSVWHTLLFSHARVSVSLPLSLYHFGTHTALLSQSLFHLENLASLLFGGTLRLRLHCLAYHLRIVRHFTRTLVYGLHIASSEICFED